MLLCLYCYVAYRNEEGLPWVLPVVRTIEAQMSSDPMLDHEYLPIDGLKSFTEAASKLVLGNDSSVLSQNRVWLCVVNYHATLLLYLTVLCCSEYFRYW